MDFMDQRVVLLTRVHVPIIIHIEIKHGIMFVERTILLVIKSASHQLGEECWCSFTYTPDLSLARREFEDFKNQLN
jgi:hypothetical protein